MRIVDDAASETELEYLSAPSLGASRLDEDLESGKDEADFSRVLSTMLLRIIDPISVDRPEQNAFRDSLIEWYNAASGNQIWCPIIQAWGKGRTAAHIVPYK
jgi:hypothetical protein